VCRLCVGGKKMPLLQRLLHVPCATACPLRTAVECVLCAMANLQPMLGPVMGHSPFTCSVRWILLIWCMVCVRWTPLTGYVVCGTLPQRGGWYMANVLLMPTTGCGFCVQ
jgi:hypothetical protein